MVETVEQRPPLTFRYGDTQASIPFQDRYGVNVVVNITSALGIKKDSSDIYDALSIVAPDSKVPPDPNDNRKTRSLTENHLQLVVKYFIDKDKAKKSKNIRSFEIADDIIIDLEGITDYNWKRFKPLLDKLRETRSQTEPGELQITPLPFEEVEKFFPNVSRTSIFRSLNELNDFLNPTGWSVEREGKVNTKGGKPFDAPWYLSGHDDIVVQNKKQSKIPKKGKIFDKNEVERTIVDERREIAEKRFDSMAFATNVLLYCTSNLAYPDDRATKDPLKIMLTLLPSDVRLEKVMDGKTPQGYFQKLIEDAVKSMAGKTKEELPEKQKPIYDFWNKIRINFKQPPKQIIFENFRPDSNEPLDETNDVNGDAEKEKEDVVQYKRARVRSRGKK